MTPGVLERFETRELQKLRYIFEVSLVFDFFDFGAFDFFDFVVFVVSCEPLSCAKTGIASEHARAAVNNSVNSFFMT